MFFGAQYCCSTLSDNFFVLTNKWALAWQPLRPALPQSYNNEHKNSHMHKHCHVSTGERLETVPGKTGRESLEPHI